MPDALAIEQFERRLIELGCPTSRLRERVRELGDHYLDLKEAALAEGCLEGEAEERAAARLGDPVVLAENLVLGMREASWWGRHPVIGFCLLPPVLLGFIWLACVGILYETCRLDGWLFGPAYNLDDGTMSALQGNTGFFDGFVKPLKLGVDVVSCLLMTLGFCWLARRSAVGWKWMLAGCGACYVATLLFWSSIQPHNLSVGFRWGMPGWPSTIPLAIGVAAFIRQRRRENRFAPIPQIRQRIRPIERAKSSFLLRLCVTPTFWVITILAVLSLWLASVRAAEVRQAAAHRVELKNKIWPAERAATLALLQARQQAVAAGDFTTINLQPWLNETLATSTDDPVPVKGNDLAGLPAGAHTFAGVPFDVAGRIQLAGKMTPGRREKLPARIGDITVGRKCARLHLLQGASNLRELNKEIARLVLHYQNGSQAEIPIISGEDVLDWWGPIYDTDSGIGRHTTSPGTELAWAGSNRWIRAHAPDFSLRLYRTTFANPHPDLEIASIDYISTLSGAAPFLVGLTVETSAHE